ncbi:MAG: amidohydrolase family protein [Geminicoccaceae bacterium]
MFAHNNRVKRIRERKRGTLIMRTLKAGIALTTSGWKENLTVTIGEDGRIATIDERAGAGTGSAPSDGRGEIRHVDLLLPAPVNLHSHAFQRAMAGLTERRGPDPRDSFWTWRQLMYRFLDHLDPGHVEAIAAFVQMEMLEAGYGCNTEFHYLHHQPDGRPYDRLAETAGRIAAAAELSGAGLTLMPVLYRHGGCDRRPLGAGQIRFGNNPDRYAKLVEDTRSVLGSLPADTRLGVAPHSLRAVTVEDIFFASKLVPDGPVHMHFVEQTAEVTEIEMTFGQRPVPYLLENINIDDRWCLVHCTQLRPRETPHASHGPVRWPALCPITESSLGDGIFDGVRWLEEDGLFGIGSDPISASRWPRNFARLNTRSACIPARVRPSRPVAARPDADCSRMPPSVVPAPPAEVRDASRSDNGPISRSRHEPCRPRGPNRRYAARRLRLLRRQQHGE